MPTPEEIFLAGLIVVAFAFFCWVVFIFATAKISDFWRKYGEKIENAFLIVLAGIFVCFVIFVIGFFSLLFYEALT